MSAIDLRLGVQQRVLPAYRAPFFDALAAACPPGLSVFAGQPRPEEAIETRAELSRARLCAARNIHIGRGGLYLCYQRGLLPWLRDWDPQALVVEANPRYLSTPAALRWMHARQRPVVGWGLGAPASGGALAGLRGALRRGFLSQFDALVTYSGQGAREYARLGYPAARIFVAPNAAAPRPTHSLPERPLMLAPHQMTLLFVGRLQARKRIDVLLQACASLPRGMQPHLWIVGDGPERANLERIARQMYPKTLFLGARQGAELARIFLAADLFVLPGTGGLAVQQAMAYGLPVMVAEADGTQTDLVRARNGWQLPPGDVDALQRQLVEALADCSRLREMGAESYRIASQEINLERMVTVFAQAVETAAAWAARRGG
jgi:glycosyltransferase involved in cell wall biosynthesis